MGYVTQSFSILFSPVPLLHEVISGDRLYQFSLRLRAEFSASDRSETDMGRGGVMTTARKLDGPYFRRVGLERDRDS